MDSNRYEVPFPVFGGCLRVSILPFDHLRDHGMWGAGAGRARAGAHAGAHVGARWSGREARVPWRSDCSLPALEHRK
jgi:hypothetical protein